MDSFLVSGCARIYLWRGVGAALLWLRWQFPWKRCCRLLHVTSIVSKCHPYILAAPASSSSSSVLNHEERRNIKKKKQKSNNFISAQPTRSSLSNNNTQKSRNAYYYTETLLWFFFRRNVCDANIYYDDCGGKEAESVRWFGELYWAAREWRTRARARDAAGWLAPFPSHPSAMPGISVPTAFIMLFLLCVCVVTEKMSHHDEDCNVSLFKWL